MGRVAIACRADASPVRRSGLALACGVAIFLLALTPVLAQTNLPPRDAARPLSWAAPVTRPGLPNFHGVSSNLYRGAQPTAEGFQELRKMGVRTVLNLRSFHSDRDLLDGAGLAYEHLYMKAWHPEDEEVIRFLALVTDTNRTPVFVHCQHGADRTGTLCALYRVLICGWTRDQAIEEMVKGGYGFHPVWTNRIDYVRTVDLDALKKKAGLGP